MEINETEDSTENVLSRMENSLNALEQMSLDSINITDKLVNGISDLQKCIEELRESPQQDKELIYEMIVELLQELLIRHLPSIMFHMNWKQKWYYKETW